MKTLDQIKDALNKEEFYLNLYGEKGQFTREGDTYSFTNPYVSHFRKSEAEDKQGAVVSQQLQGKFALYEQPYEQDKVQIYRLPAPFQEQLSIRDNTKSTGKQMVRVLGRVTGCGPFKNEWDQCYEDDFDAEFETLKGQL